MTSIVEHKKRELWSSRAAFIFVSIGAAVGYGNVWRFPALAYEFGGGAFFIPYLLALFIIGIPLVILEVGMGQVYRTGDVGCFGGMHGRLRGIGICSLICGYTVILYYIPLLAWTTNAFFDAMKDFDEKYKFTFVDGVMETPWQTHFKPNIIGMETLPASLEASRIVPDNAGYLALVYVVMYLCLAFGVKITGRIAYFTMGVPIILLFAFVIRCATLDGASDGIKAYIGEWDMKVLEDGEVWSRAVSQIFFSLGLCLGIFTAYGSSNKETEPVISNVIIISLSNSFFSFIAGFAIFSALGNLSLIMEKPIEKVVDAGPGLVFGTYPTVLAQLTNGAAWVRLFFFFLFLLGIDSGFAIFEGVLIVVTDTPLGNKLGKPVCGAVLSVIAFLVGLLFATDAGLLWLDVVDFYVNYLLLFVGFLETFAAGWVFGHKKQIAEIGTTLVYGYAAVTWGSLFFASAIWWGINNGDELWAGFIALLIPYILGMAGIYSLAGSAATEREMSRSDVLSKLFMGNVMDLRKALGTHLGETYFPVAWAFNVKHIMPQLLWLCFVNLCAQETPSGKSTFGNYEGYEAWPYQTVGILIFAISLFSFLLGVFVPGAYGGLLTEEIEQNVAKVNKSALSPDPVVVEVKDTEEVA